MGFSEENIDEEKSIEYGVGRGGCQYRFVSDEAAAQFKTHSRTGRDGCGVILLFL